MIHKAKFYSNGYNLDDNNCPSERIECPYPDRCLINGTCISDKYHTGVGCADCSLKWLF